MMNKKDEDKKVIVSMAGQYEGMQVCEYDTLADCDDLDCKTENDLLEFLKFEGIKQGYKVYGDCEIEVKIPV